LVAVQFVESEYYAGGGAGVRISPRLRLGASLLGVYESESFTFVQVGRAADGRSASTVSIRSGTSYDLTLRAGLQWEPARWLSIGVALFAPNLVVARKSSGAVTSPVPGSEVTSTSDISLSTDTQRGGARFTGAPGVRAGVAYRHEGGWVALDGTISPPMQSGDLGVDRKLSFNLRLGMVQTLSGTWSLGAGAFTDRNALRARGTDYYGLSFGVMNTRRYLLHSGRAISFVTGLSGRYAYGSGASFGTTVPSLAPGQPFMLQQHDGDIRSHELSASIGSAVSF
jgi:hypothetical protein